MSINLLNASIDSRVLGVARVDGGHLNVTTPPVKAVHVFRHGDLFYRAPMKSTHYVPMGDYRTPSNYEYPSISYTVNSHAIGVAYCIEGQTVADETVKHRANVHSNYMIKTNSLVEVFEEMACMIPYEIARPILFSDRGGHLILVTSGSQNSPTTVQFNYFGGVSAPCWEDFMIDDVRNAFAALKNRVSTLAIARDEIGPNITMLATPAIHHYCLMNPWYEEMPLHLQWLFNVAFSGVIIFSPLASVRHNARMVACGCTMRCVASNDRWVLTDTFRRLMFQQMNPAELAMVSKDQVGPDEQTPFVLLYWLLTDTDMVTSPFERRNIGKYVTFGCNSPQYRHQPINFGVCDHVVDNIVNMYVEFRGSVRRYFEFKVDDLRCWSAIMAFRRVTPAGYPNLTLLAKNLDDLIDSLSHTYVPCITRLQRHDLVPSENPTVVFLNMIHADRGKFSYMMAVPFNDERSDYVALCMYLVGIRSNNLFSKNDHVLSYVRKLWQKEAMFYVSRNEIAGFPEVSSVTTEEPKLVYPNCSYRTATTYTTARFIGPEINEKVCVVGAKYTNLKKLLEAMVDLMHPKFPTVPKRHFYKAMKGICADSARNTFFETTPVGTDFRMEIPLVLSSIYERALANFDSTDHLHKCSLFLTILELSIAPHIVAQYPRETIYPDLVVGDLGAIVALTLSAVTSTHVGLDRRERIEIREGMMVGLAGNGYVAVSEN